MAFLLKICSNAGTLPCIQSLSAFHLALEKSGIWLLTVPPVHGILLFSGQI
jgi:hypothetical protein